MEEVRFDAKQPPKDSLGKRYAYKVLTSVLGILLTFISQAIVTRGLGPKEYGDFSFLTNFFSQLVAFFDMNTSLCLYTKLSQRPNEKSLNTFYFYVILVVLSATFLFVAVASRIHMSEDIWPGQTLFFVYIAAGWAAVSWILQVLNKILDAYGVTVLAEKAILIQRILGTLFLIILWAFNGLDLGSYFYYQYLVIGLLALIFICFVDRYCFSIANAWIISISEIKKYINEFKVYVTPLFVLTLFSLLTGVADRWLLQVYGGSIQQGFFGISYQIGAVCFIFSRAMTPLISRELSIAFANSDIVEMAKLFQRYVPSLYFVAAFFSCFIFFQADKALYLLGGEAYYDAMLAVMIMSMYPIHQTYGQLSGAVFFATGATRLYSTIGCFFMIVGLPITYFLVAPMGNLGVASGAVGLAIKMVVLQFLVVNVQLYYNSRLLQISFAKHVFHQCYSLAILLAISWFVAKICTLTELFSSHVITGFIISGTLYTIIVIFSVWAFPFIAGIKRQDFHKIKLLAVSKLKSN